MTINKYFHGFASPLGIYLTFLASLVTIFCRMLAVQNYLQHVDNLKQLENNQKSFLRMMMIFVCNLSDIVFLLFAVVTGGLMKRNLVIVFVESEES
ncbi:unnamed protein product [Brassica napus]|uniref:(rape) hypothetical protein n=1 Tax=Brassica napus TaxID=3708 RepID=A0A816UML5_BRANA|nr:unnamed protein product [Brassica napus]